MLTAARLREDSGPAGWTGSPRCAPRRSRSGPRRRAAAVPVRCPGPGRDHHPGVPRGTAGGLQQPVPGSRAGPQARTLLAATEGELGKIAAAAPGMSAVARQGQDRLRVNRVLRHCKMAKHFTLEVTEDSLQRHPQRARHHRRGQPRRDLCAAHQACPETWTDSKSSPPTRPSPMWSGSSAPSTPTRYAAHPAPHRDRVRAHVFLRMLSYYISWHMQARPSPILFPDNDKPAAQAARTSPVAPAARSPRAVAKAAIKQIPTTTPPCTAWPACWPTWPLSA